MSYNTDSVYKRIINNFNTMNIIPLAQVLGVILTVSGLSIFINKKGVMSLIEETTRNHGFLWFYGFITLLIGTILVELNNAWSSGLRILISLLSWIILLKGLFILLLPNNAISLQKKLNSSGMLTFGGILGIVVGVVLLYKGFM